MLNWFTQICLALKHCHDRKILHRDLKSQNVFLTKRDFIKLGDFGIARVLSNTGSFAKTVVGTPYYLSPEIIGSAPYSFKSDIWSLGVLLYEMCALQPPFNASSLSQLAQRIMAARFDKLPSNFSPQINALLSSILIKDPKKRPTVHEILRMPLIKKRISKYLEEDDFRDEFSHTLLHNQDVFKAFQDRKTGEESKQQAAQAAAAAKAEEERRKTEERQRQQEVQQQILSNMKRQKDEEEARGKMQ